MSESPSIPDAQVESSRSTGPRWSWMWLATILCVLMAGAFGFSQFWDQGSVIQVSFKQGHGLKPGDRLRYRGLDVGEVERVEIRP